MKKEVLVPIIISAVIFASVGFFGGMQFQKSQRSSFAGGRQGNFMMTDGNGGGQRGGANGSRGGMMTQGFRPITGEIISADGNSITVKLEDGSSKIVLVSDTTPINKTDPADKNALTNGTKVAVFGSENNGTVTAQSIQLNPQIKTGTPSAQQNK